MKRFGQLLAEERIAYPYEVYHEGEGYFGGKPQRPVFKTWEEALARQVDWNRGCPGHRARKRRDKDESSN